jgi:hypothetical protein
VQSSYYDHAKIYVSSDGINWTQLWENPVFDLTDNQWTQVVFDISSIAANQPTVYIKFAMGPTDSSSRFSGWNIDDLEITSDYTGPLALYVPSGNIPNPNIDEILIENGLGIQHFDQIPSDLSDYSLVIVSKDEACDSTTANYIKNFVQNGGGAIIIGGIPKLLAGNTDDLSTISDWFGAGWYGNDCGYATVAIDNLLGTDLKLGDNVDYAATSNCSADSVYGENAEIIVTSKWANQGRTHSFLHNFGGGGLFYYAGDPGYPEDSDPVTVENGLILFEAGLGWVANPYLITLHSPSDETIFSSCSFISGYQPTFSWTAVGTYSGFKILFSASSTDFTTLGIKVAAGSVMGTSNSWKPSSLNWKTIMKSSNNNGSIRPIYWKVIGARSDRTTVESEVRSFSIGGPEAQVVTINAPLDDAILDPATPPTFDFDTNCNTRFKLEISSLSDFSVLTKTRGFNFMTSNPNLLLSLQKTLSSFQWSAVKRLIGAQIGYFRIKAWDGLNRETVSEIRTFTIQ